MRKAFLLIFCFAVALGILIAIEYHNRRISVVLDWDGSNAKQHIVESTLGSLDTDSDGLEDWEETIWKTDPANHDTDGDGTTDGAEVEEGRNPAFPSPGDSLGNAEGAPPAKGDRNKRGSEEKISESERFARTFFAKYLSLKQTGQTLSLKEKESLISDLFRSGAFRSRYRKFTAAEVSLSTENKQETIRKYGNDMGDIIRSHSPRGSEHELSIFARSIEEENRDEIKKLDPIIRGYRSIIEDSVSVEAPPGAVDLHLSVLTALERIEKTISGMRDLWSDELTALAALGEYQRNVEFLRETFLSVRRFFEEQGIIYTPSDGGYTFTHSIM